MSNLGVALRTVVKNIDDLNAEVYFGNAPNGAVMPYITFRKTDRTTIDVMQNAYKKIEYWDFKAWASSATEVERITDLLFETLHDEDNVPRDCASVILARNFAMMSEENRPNEIVYSQVVEAEVVI